MFTLPATNSTLPVSSGRYVRVARLDDHIRQLHDRRHALTLDEAQFPAARAGAELQAIVVGGENVAGADQREPGIA